MRGSSRLLRFSLVGALALAFTLSACKKGKSSSNANEAASHEPNPSGLMTVDGMYTYLADAGIFEDCATGEKWPVATEGDKAALERAYTSSGVEPGSPLLVTVDGRVDLRPKIDGPGRENVLIIERFVRVRPRETCGSMTPMALENVSWALLELNGCHRVGSESQLQAVRNLLDPGIRCVSQIHDDPGDHVRLLLELGNPHSLDRVVLDHDAGGRRPIGDSEQVDHEAIGRIEVEARKVEAAITDDPHDGLTVMTRHLDAFELCRRDADRFTDRPLNSIERRFSRRNSRGWRCRWQSLFLDHDRLHGQGVGFVC